MVFVANGAEEKLTEIKSSLVKGFRVQLMAPCAGPVVMDELTTFVDVKLDV
jgi:hypothetical protein